MANVVIEPDPDIQEGFCEKIVGEDWGISFRNIMP